MLLLAIILVGMVAGWAANRLAGRRARPWSELFLIGIAGSFVGGLLGSLLVGDGLRLRPSGLIGSVLGSILVVLALRAFEPKSRGTRR